MVRIPSFKKSSVPFSKIFVGIVLSLIAFLWFYHVFVGTVFYSNTTVSNTRGLYLRSLDQKLNYNDCVILKDVVPYHKLLKMIKGFPGDEYVVTDTSLEIRGMTYPIQKNDSIPHLVPGIYTVSEDTVLCLNPNPNSFDSRYLGPIGIEHLEAKVILVLPYDDIGNFINTLYGTVARKD